jgi:hypothetical protein
MRVRRSIGLAFKGPQSDGADGNADRTPIDFWSHQRGARRRTGTHLHHLKVRSSCAAPRHDCRSSIATRNEPATRQPGRFPVLPACSTGAPVWRRPRHSACSVSVPLGIRLADSHRSLLGRPRGASGSISGGRDPRGARRRCPARCTPGGHPGRGHDPLRSPAVAARPTIQRAAGRSFHRRGSRQGGGRRPETA